MSLIKNNLKYRILLLFFLIIFFSCQETYASKDFNYFNFIKEMKSFSSSFIQNTYNENGLLVTTSKGSLVYKKKSKTQRMRPGAIFPCPQPPREADRAHFGLFWCNGGALEFFPKIGS